MYSRPMRTKVRIRPLLERQLMIVLESSLGYYLLAVIWTTLIRVLNGDSTFVNLKTTYPLAVAGYTCGVGVFMVTAKVMWVWYWNRKTIWRAIAFGLITLMPTMMVITVITFGRNFFDGYVWFGASFGGVFWGFVLGWWLRRSHRRIT